MNHLYQRTNRIKALIALGATTACAVPFVFQGNTATAQVPPPPPVFLPVPLNTIPVPLPVNLDVYVKDRAAAIRLGKALFWDMQVGSDGVTACASGHYQARADGRYKNQLAQGPDGRWDSGHALNQQLTTTTRFPFTKFDNGHAVNFQLKLDTHFPFTKFTDALNNASPKIRSSNDIVSSQGVFKADFLGLSIDAQGVGSIGALDAGVVRPDATFNKLNINTRQVTGRNSPSVINAIYNNRNFWDGRAHNEFNGVNPFGNSDVNARVYETDPVTGLGTATQISILNASLASQAVGPVNSDVEMAHGGRNFAVVAKKLLGLKPLALQKVAVDDSVLGTVANPVKGIDTTMTR